MEREYKEFAIRAVYGSIQTTGAYLKQWVGKRFFERFGIQPDIIEVVQTDKYINENDRFNSIWVGSLTLNLTVDGETFSVKRDWNEEYEYDSKHPCYNDDYFYESESCYSFKKYRELINSLNK